MCLIQLVTKDIVVLILSQGVKVDWYLFVVTLFLRSHIVDLGLQTVKLLHFYKTIVTGLNKLKQASVLRTCGYARLLQTADKTKGTGGQIRWPEAGSS